MRVRRRRITWPAAVAAGVVIAGAGTTYAVTAGPDSPSYRTVTATKGNVEQTLTLAGLVDAARRADLSFATDGTVAKVLVAQGQKVRAGQVVARLETGTLDAAVTSAVATLAQARAQLASDESAQSASVQDATNQPQSSKTPQGSSPQQSSNPATAALLKKLKAEQQAVVDAQGAASAALSTAADALSAQTQACATAYRASSTPSDAPSDGSTPGSGDDGSDEAACDAALVAVQDAQAAVKKAQDDLADALDALASTLGQALGSQSSSPSSSSNGSARTAGTDTPASDQASDQGSGGTVTAARLAADQARIDQARADLVSARTARAAAVLRSTRSGTVASIDLARGDSVTSGTSVAVVVGGSAVTLTGTVPESAISELAVGQVARVSVPGSSRTTTGTVTAIGLTADTSTGSTTYPVTVTVEDPSIALPTGSRAQVAIVLATAKDVVTLPISAVSRSGSGAVVRTWDGKSLARRTVTLGAVGSRTVAITRGLAAGQKVVVADVDEAITGASSELDQRGTFGPPGGGQFVFRGPGGTGPAISKAGG